jgi:hypothetical protein
MSNQASRGPRGATSFPAQSGTRSRRSGGAPKRSGAGVSAQDTLVPISVPPKKPVIYVMAIEGTPDTAGFSLSEKGPFAEGGVVFVFAKPQTITATWVLGAGISKLSSPDLEFSSVVKGEQTLTLSSTPGQGQLLPFFVHFDSGEQHDPQVVITPIGGGVPPTPVKSAAGKRSAAKTGKRPAATKIAATTRTPVKKALRGRAAKG